MVNGPDPAVGFGGANILLVACNLFNYYIKLIQGYPEMVSIFLISWIHLQETYLHFIN